jgi:hypothetical protein
VGTGRGDAGGLEGAERVECAEELEGAGEVVDDLDACVVVVIVARRRQGVDTACVFVVFVGPEMGVGTAVGGAKGQRYVTGAGMRRWEAYYEATQ